MTLEPGFPSLASVRSLAYLKIDRSFVWSMEEMTVKIIFLIRVFQIARAVGAQLIAEGVENEHQVSNSKPLEWNTHKGISSRNPYRQEFSDISGFGRTRRLRINVTVAEK